MHCWHVVDSTRKSTHLQHVHRLDLALASRLSSRSVSARMPTRRAGINTMVCVGTIRCSAVEQSLCHAEQNLVHFCLFVSCFGAEQCACLQEARYDHPFICNDNSTGDCEEEDGAAQQTAQGLVGARQLIVDAVELLQVGKAGL